jgi:hypothetical protein
VGQWRRLRHRDNVKQNSRSAEDFAAELENISEKMTAIMIRKNNVVTNEARIAVKSIYKGKALAAFVNGLKSSLRLAVVFSLQILSRIN